MIVRKGKKNVQCSQYQLHRCRCNKLCGQVTFVINSKIRDRGSQSVSEIRGTTSEAYAESRAIPAAKFQLPSRRLTISMAHIELDNRIAPEAVNYVHREYFSSQVCPLFGLPTQSKNMLLSHSLELQAPMQWLLKLSLGAASNHCKMR